MGEWIVEQNCGCAAAGTRRNGWLLLGLAALLGLSACGNPKQCLTQADCNACEDCNYGSCVQDPAKLNACGQINENHLLPLKYRMGK